MQYMACMQAPVYTREGELWWCVNEWMPETGGRGEKGLGTGGLTGTRSVCIGAIVEASTRTTMAAGKQFQGKGFDVERLGEGEQKGKPEENLSAAGSYRGGSMNADDPALGK